MLLTYRYSWINVPKLFEYDDIITKSTYLCRCLLLLCIITSIVVYRCLTKSKI